MVELGYLLNTNFAIEIKNPLVMPEEIYRSKKIGSHHIKKIMYDVNQDNISIIDVRLYKIKNVIRPDMT